jgi:hypothetical protein
MADDQLDAVFTTQRPLGPIAIDDETDPTVLRALYDSRVNLHITSQHSPPTFIVGRRGSGKTSLLLSSQLDESNLTIHLSTAGAFSRVQAAVDALQARLLLTEEGVADIWSLLLWGPIAVRLAERHRDRDPHREYQVLWETTAPLRALVPRNGIPGISYDDLILDHLAQQFTVAVRSMDTVLGTDALGRHFCISGRPWVEGIEAARAVATARKAKIFVLIDSLENIGAQIGRLELTLKGLFHLVGRIGMQTSRRPFRLQCCFPSELWPLLHKISSNPVKDFADRVVLQWSGDDLLRAAALRLNAFLERQFPEMAVKPEDSLDLFRTLFPARIKSGAGLVEPSIAYMLRHTHLLPRQFIYILNEALHRAIVATEQPVVRSSDIIGAVAEVETTLCPEVFAAHMFRYPAAEDITRQLVPYLPFRFTEGHLHSMYNRAGIQQSFGIGYRTVLEMLSHIGLFGRFVGEERYYAKAEFEYTVEGSLNLSPDDEYCLHPLFVRLYASRDIVKPSGETKPVYPLGTPIG